LSDERLVVVEVGQSFGLDVARGEPWVTLENALKDQEVLIVLDNCEHLIDAAASLADRLLRTCPRVRILTTSREPLEAEAEWVFRLPPLAMPAPDAHLALEEVLSYPAVQLFVDRASATGGAFELSDADAPDVRQLCEFLDGIPLAIELAAARVHSLGIQGLLHRLEDAFDLLTRGRRTAMSRHQTLHAVMNWSYALLTDTERSVLQRLSVFRSAFDLDGGIAVASTAELGAHRVVEAVMNLCSKSLLVREAAPPGEPPRHRLLYITRLFAERMLSSTPDEKDVRRRHAVFMLEGLRDLERVRTIMAGFRRSAVLASTIAETRAAIHWTLFEENDLRLGLEIVAESSMIWHVAGLVEEFGQHLNVALDKAARAGIEGTALAARLQMTVGLISSQVLRDSASHRRALAIDRSLVDRFERPVDKIEALVALCASAHGRGDFLQVMDCCEEVRELAQGELEHLSVAVGDRFSALALHELGQHDAAERLAHRVMQVNADTLDSAFRSALSFGLSMRIRLARIHWLRGEFRQAWELAQQVAAQDDETHVYAKCHPLALAAIPMAIWKGDLQQASRWCQDLLLHSTRGKSPYWQAYATLYRGLLDGGSPTRGGPEFQLLEKNTPLMDMVAVLQSGAPHPDTLARVHKGEVGWCAPEVLRLAALAALDPGDGASRDHCIAELRRAYDLSLEQGARYWSLRIAISLCEVTAQEHRDHVAARGLVLSLLSRIDDGSTQPDLQQARRWAQQTTTTPGP
jgi:predicted ATPase